MKEIEIKQLGYNLKQAKKDDLPQPIVFLGAGASRTGNIPLAAEIEKDILEMYSDNPSIEKLIQNKRTYANLMECLLPNQRNELLKKYIEKAKINVTHIYLAQLMNEGYIDYVHTVNFDNLMLRALALYNIFPPTYDMAILKDLTTTTFKEKSVVYLHGQHHGLWLLNTPEEMQKVMNTVSSIFHSIKNQRPWIFIGYSGDDPIFEHIKNLGRFDNGLYWIAYKDNDPNEKVREFLNLPNTNTSIVKGYDSDSFMIKLNNELGLPQPLIIDKPFSTLGYMLDEIVDIDDQEHYKYVKERLDINKKQVKKAVDIFEKGKLENKNLSENKVDNLKKEIIKMIISENYEEKNIVEIEMKLKDNSDDEANNLLAGLYSNWGANLVSQAKTNEGKKIEELFRKAFEKYQKAIEIKPDFYQAYYNWGYCLANLANTKEGKEAEELFRESLEKYQKAIEIKPDLHEAHNNWGHYLGNLAKTKEGVEAEKLFREAFEKYQKAIEIKPDFHEAYNNWGADLVDLAKAKEGEEAGELFRVAFKKYKKAIEIKPEFHEAYYNWGTSLVNLAKIKEGKEAEKLYRAAFEKYQMAISIKPGFHEAYYDWGTNLVNLAKSKEGEEAEELCREAFEKYQKAIDLGGQCYNLACLYAIKGKTKEALHCLNLSLSNSEIDKNYVKKDDDWKNYLDNLEFIKILKKY